MFFRNRKNNKKFRGYSASAKDGDGIWILHSDTGKYEKFDSIEELFNTYETITVTRKPLAPKEKK